MENANEASHIIIISINLMGKFINLVQLTPQLGMRAVRIVIVVSLYIGIMVAIKNLLCERAVIHFIYTMISFSAMTLIIYK